MTHTTQQGSANFYLNDLELPEHAPRVLTARDVRPRYPKSFQSALYETIRNWTSKPFGALVFEAYDCYGYIKFHGKLLAKIHKATGTVVQINVPSENTKLARFHLRQMGVHVVKKSRKEWLFLNDGEKIELELDKNVYLWPGSTEELTTSYKAWHQLPIGEPFNYLPIGEPLNNPPIVFYSNGTSSGRVILEGGNRVLIGNSTDNGQYTIQTSGTFTFDTYTGLVESYEEPLPVDESTVMSI